MKWARHHENGYEVTSRGDKRFSAFFARLADGRSIEDAYQLDVKGFRAITNDWRNAKGQPPHNGKTRDQMWNEYLDLWRIWAGENPDLILELMELSKGKVLTDRFASTSVNQAHALSIILTELEEPNLPFIF